MKIKLSMVIFLLMATVGCSNNSSTNDESQSAKEETGTITGQQQNEKDEINDSEDQSTSNPIKEEQNEKEDQTTGESKKEVKENEGVYNQYRPEVGTERIFTESGTEMFSEEIIAENEDFIQILVSIGGSTTTEVYKWTSDELRLVLQTNEISEPRKSILNDFEEGEKQDIIIGENSNWKLIDKNLELTIPSGMYKNVVSVEKITEEVVGEETIYTRFYAPKMGLIKEIVEVTGENGYKGESSLDKINK